jgi:photosystem II stability/assembly factor-like uncharacterized protein
LIFAISFQACKRPKPQWEKLNIGLNDSFHDIEAIERNTLLAYSYGTGLIIKTWDAGKNWKIVHKTDSIYFEQIEFPSPEIGFICGNTNKILKTENGGDDWLEISLDPIPESASIYGMKFIGIEIGYFALLKRTEHGYGSDIYHSTNSGQDWTLINSIPEMLLNIELVNGDLWASGHNVVLKNIDKNWQTVYKDTSGEVGQIRDFVFRDETLIMASFNGYIISKEGDQVRKNKITENRIRSIVEAERNMLFAAGDNNREKGNIFESFDNGKTWKLIENDLPDIHRLYIKDKIIWGVGKQDALIKLEI